MGNEKCIEIRVCTKFRKEPYVYYDAEWYFENVTGGPRLCIKWKKPHWRGTLTSIIPQSEINYICVVEKEDTNEN